MAEHSIVAHRLRHEFLSRVVSYRNVKYLVGEMSVK